MEAYSRLVVNKDDFEEVRAVGRGRYGTTIHLCRDLTTANRDLCALKTIPKRDASDAFDAAQACRERNALCRAADSRWLVGLRYAMQDRANLYLVTEYLPGGDLRALMNRNDGALSEELTLFYLAELTVALNCLHKLGFAHLDLRPENVGLDRLGHAKLLVCIVRDSDWLKFQKYIEFLPRTLVPLRRWTRRGTSSRAPTCTAARSTWRPSCPWRWPSRRATATRGRR